MTTGREHELLHVDEPEDAVARGRSSTEDAGQVRAEHARDDGDERDEHEQLDRGAQSFSGANSA